MTLVHWYRIAAATAFQIALTLSEESRMSAAFSGGEGSEGVVRLGS